MPRVLLTTVRKANKPLSAQEIAVQVMAGSGLNTVDKGLLRIMTKRVGSSLRNVREKGLVRSSEAAGRRVVGKPLSSRWLVEFS